MRAKDATMCAKDATMSAKDAALCAKDATMCAKDAPMCAMALRKREVAAVHAIRIAWTRQVARDALNFRGHVTMGAAPAPHRRQ